MAVSRSLLAVGLISLVPAPGMAAWPAGNLKVCPDQVTRARSTSIADGAGGQIIVCEESYRGQVDLYVQRLNSSGSRQWGSGNGLALCTATGEQRFPVIVSDGAGGAIIAWQDSRGASGDIYVQRVNSAGAAQWTANGVALCAAANNQAFPSITTDGANGAIVSWMDGRSGSFDIYARRINSAGTPQWVADGVALCTFAGNQTSPVIVADASGGAVVAWPDPRSGNSDVYAQRVNSSGMPQWTANGVALCATTGDQDGPSIVSDGASGAIVAWRDARGGVNTDVYAQRVSSGGLPQWLGNGVALCTAGGDQGFPSLVTDGGGGAVVAWDDDRSADLDLYAQRVNNLGMTQWAGNGVAVCSVTGTQTTPRLVADGSGGAVVGWSDFRDGHYDLYVQRIGGAAGAQLWAPGGVALRTAPDNVVGLELVPDGFGGAIATWDDQRAAQDTYAQRVDNSGAPSWAVDGVRAFTASDQQQNLAMASDGASGAIIVFEETFRGISDLYAQRVSPSGALLWGANGVAVCTANGTQGTPSAVPDGAGGVVIAWSDLRTDAGDIFVQRLNSSGVPQWTGNGVALCTATGPQAEPLIVGNAAGSTVVWTDYRTGVADVYARRVDAAGAPQWAANGVALCTATGNQYLRDLAFDGSNAIACWEDYRGANADIFAQKVNASGVVQWVGNGAGVCLAAGDQVEPALTATGLGGAAILTWQDSRTGQAQIYARLVSSGGAPSWTPDGNLVCSQGSLRPVILADGTGGVIIAWTDSRGNIDPYAQRLNGAGATQWTLDGVALCLDPFVQAPRAIVTDGGNGAIVGWLDDRYTPGEEDIFTRAINGGGTPQGPVNGAPTTVHPGRQTGMAMIVGADGAILAWQDLRSGTSWDIYANSIGPIGAVAVPSHEASGALWLGSAFPNPSIGSTEFRFQLPERAHVVLGIYDLQGRRLRTLLDATVEAGPSSARWDGLADGGRVAPAGVYLCRIEAAGHTAVSKVVRTR